MPMGTRTFRYPKLLATHHFAWRTRCALVALLVIAAPALAQAGNSASSGAAAAGLPPGVITASQPTVEKAGAYQWGSDLGLSTAQRAAINHIRDQARQQRWSLLDAIRDQHARLRDLYGAPTLDQPAVDAALRTLRQLRRQMTRVSKAEHQRIDAILTPRQRNKRNQDLLRDDQQIW
ncbi:Spy/CpxP family protein refolding chaperone [Pandoraea sp.]|uniref:Spy/CpxP family protein refolding chaperone n=1 Tax=Pandoraea sp. TaxID=1883445 RepID=UPI001208644B|nr:Spy/CpxP family protein refolding chaperone [Pandoraea sp.]TAL53895.1 MAG: periplasmic heavy metal sensor [Pandoraea sp.]TAM17204.1 MAG: periplasmic heavy metal sensor [Pandoraea sp.]